MRYLALVFVCTICGLLAGAENALSGANVGEWAEYKISSRSNTTIYSFEQRQQVVSKSASSARVEVTTRMAGQEAKSYYDISLSAAYDVSGRDPEKAPLNQTQSQQTLQVAGKNTAVTVVETTYEVSKDRNTTAKVWKAAGVPLGGLVRMESSAGADEQTVVELIKYGTK